MLYDIINNLYGLTWPQAFAFVGGMLSIAWVLVTWIKSGDNE